MAEESKTPKPRKPRTPKAKPPLQAPAPATLESEFMRRSALPTPPPTPESKMMAEAAQIKPTRPGIGGALKTLGKGAGAYMVGSVLGDITKGIAESEPVVDAMKARYEEQQKADLGAGYEETPVWYFGDDEKNKEKLIAQAALPPMGTQRPGDVEDYLGKYEKFARDEAGRSTMLDDFKKGEVPVGVIQEGMGTQPYYQSEQPVPKQGGIDLGGNVNSNIDLSTKPAALPEMTAPQRQGRAALPTWEDLFTRYLKMAGGGRTFASANIVNAFAPLAAAFQLDSLSGNAARDRQDEKDIYQQWKDNEALKQAAAEERRQQEALELDKKYKMGALDISQAELQEKQRKNKMAEEWAKANFDKLSPEEQLLVQTGQAGRIMEIRERAAEQRKLQHAKMIEEAMKQYGDDEAALNEAISQANAWLEGGGGPVERYLDVEEKEAYDPWFGARWFAGAKSVPKQEAQYAWRPKQVSALGPIR